MLVPVPKKITVYTDSREKIPLLFPETIRYFPERTAKTGRLIQVVNERKKLSEGDYCLAKWPDKALVERKGSLEELSANLLSVDYKRFSSALDRLSQAAEVPILLVDCGPGELWRPSYYCPEPGVILDSLYRELAIRGIRFLWVGPCKTTKARRMLGEHVLRMMLCYAIGNPEKNVQEIVPENLTTGYD